jgi:hypothetical protein
MWLCRMKTYLCSLTKPIFAAQPQNKDRRKMYFDTTPLLELYQSGFWLCRNRFCTCGFAA